MHRNVLSRQFAASFTLYPIGIPALYYNMVAIIVTTSILQEYILLPRLQEYQYLNQHKETVLHTIIKSLPNSSSLFDCCIIIHLARSEIFCEK